MLTYLKESFRRKKARRFTREYPSRLCVYHLPGEGHIEFANWDNPLVSPYHIRQETVDFFKQFIGPGDFVIDIGAHIGDTTVPMALAAGTSGLTLGFDPNPYVFKILSENAALNKDKTNIVPLPYAISSQEEEFYFISSEASFANGGVSSTRKSRHGKFIYPEKIRGVNLEMLLERQYGEWLPDLSFIKVDAEGYDAVILDSIANLIAARKPVIFAEIFVKDGELEKSALYQAIDRHGYDLYSFEAFDIGSEAIPVESQRDITRWTRTMNVYATPSM